MPKIITTDEQLREYVPNVFATVDDENTLFEKISPFLGNAENWLIDNILTAEVFNLINKDKDDVYNLVAHFTALSAFADAVPSLDLVLTPNGFGIVNNNNIVPASKERVERLIASLNETKWEVLATILRKICLIPEWQESERCHWFALSIFQDFSCLTKKDPDKWTALIATRDEASDIEREVANGWISPEIYNKLCSGMTTQSLTQTEKSVFIRVRAIIINIINKGVWNYTSLDDLVNYIRNNPVTFPEWQSSETSKLFSPPIFENKKDSGGYFF